MKRSTMRGVEFLNPVGVHYEPGDERYYDVVYRGVTIGTVERLELPVGDTEGVFIKGWSFRGSYRGVNVSGEGPTRVDAVFEGLKDVLSLS